MKHASRTLRYVQFTLIAAGLLGIGIYLFTVIEARVYQNYEEWVFDRELEGRPAGIAGFIGFAVWGAPPLNWQIDSSPLRSQDPGPAEGGTAAEDGGAPLGFVVISRSGLVFEVNRAASIDPKLIGKLEIPRLGMVAMVRQGIDSTTLRRAVGHIPGSALPGERGNIGLSAHRDTFFGRLRDIQKLDRIRIRTLKGTYEYVVDTISIVEPGNTSVLRPTEKPVLTLLTCYPFTYVGHAPKRFVVRAHQISNN